MSRWLIGLLATIVLVGALFAVSPFPVHALGGPVFTVMNTNETLPDGVWFRNSPHTADTSQITGVGVYMNEQVQLQCYTAGDAVGPYNNKIWYYVANITRPTVDGQPNEGYLNAHYINDGAVSNQVDAGVPQCDTAPAASPVSTPNATFQRSIAAQWATEHAQDPQEASGLCTIFVSRALWAAALPRSSTWYDGTDASKYVASFIAYMTDPANGISTQLIPITNDLRTNAVPQAQIGDVIVYSWNGSDDLNSDSHLAIVVNIGPGQYPNVSEWGISSFLPPNRAIPVTDPYTSRGWTWSQLDHKWLQDKYPHMTAYLLHFNGGILTPSY